MDLIQQNDARYDEMRTVFNSMVDKRPAVIARCATADDVIDALALARAEGYEVAVRAGGHSVAGMCLNDGGLVIDVRPMKQAEVDPTARTIRAGAGLTWAEFDEHVRRHIEWMLPTQRPALAQGLVAFVPTKLWMTNSAVLLIFATAYADELLERLT